MSARDDAPTAARTPRPDPRAGPRSSRPRGGPRAAARTPRPDPRAGADRAARLDPRRGPKSASKCGPAAVAGALVALAALTAAAGCASAPPHERAGDARPVLFVVGMQDEARVAAGPGAVVVVSGANPAHLRALLARVDPSSVRAVVSFGVAGALFPSLHPGAVVVADRVLCADGAWPVDPALTKELVAGAARAGEHARRVAFFGVDTMTSTPADRARIRKRTGAGALDMESHVAARFAAEHGLPFASLRTISDGVTFTLPPAMAASIALDGGVDVAAVARSVAGDPAQIPVLLEAGKGYGKALDALERCRRALRL